MYLMVEVRAILTMETLMYTPLGWLVSYASNSCTMTVRKRKLKSVSIRE